MQLNPDRAELLSAASDLLLALLAGAGAVRVGRRDWRLAFALLGAASVLGALVHGLAWSPAVLARLWWPLDLLMAGSLASFAAVAVRDGGGADLARRARHSLLGLALLMTLTARAFPDTLLPFLGFEVGVLVGSAWVWNRRALARRQEGAGLLVAGCLVALAAAGVAASGFRIDGPWPLDANTLFHLAQAPAVLLWIRGARASEPAARA